MFRAVADTPPLCVSKEVACTRYQDAPSFKAYVFAILAHDAAQSASELQRGSAV